MSEKRTSHESGMLQQEDNAKRTRLSASSNTTLQDLPIELLERILVQVVSIEVKGLKMAKCAWKDNVDLVISRLEAVCPLWSNIFTTSVFRIEVNRILDESAQEKTRLDMICQSAMQSVVIDLTSIREEMFLLCRSSGSGQDCFINVYERSNIEKVKEVFLLPKTCARSIEGCSVSSCLYVLREESTCLSVLRITEDEEHQFNISPWISDLSLCDSNMYVSANGSLILSLQLEPEPAEFSIYNASGSLQQKIVLADFYVQSIMQKPNGNLVMLSLNSYINSELIEIDMTGRIVRQHQPSALSWINGSFMDVYGRIFVHYSPDRIELFDSEFNSLSVTGPRTYKGQNIDPKRWHYNREANEMVSIVRDNDSENGFLAIFRFAEE